MIENEPESRTEWMLKRFEWAAKSNIRNEKRQFWNYGNHPEEIFTEKFFWIKVTGVASDYIHMNPIRAKIVSKAFDYLYSSASNYVGKESFFEGITLMNNPIIDLLKNNWTVDIQNW